jgi:hypothetical protein
MIFSWPQIFHCIWNKWATTLFRNGKLPSKIRSSNTPTYVSIEHLLHSLFKTQKVSTKSSFMTDCNPAPSPHVDSHDLSSCRPGEITMPNIQSYQSLVGSQRYFADTTYPAIAFIDSVLGRHLHQTTARHMAAAHRVLR